MALKYRNMKTSISVNMVLCTLHLSGSTKPGVEDFA